MIQEMGSFVEGSKDPTTQTSTLKFVEEVVVEKMKANKIVELFQTMAIMSLNMGKFDSGGKYFEEQQSYKGGRKGSVIGGIG